MIDSEERPILIKRIVLDVLKPHQPDVLEFARLLAGNAPGCAVKVSAVEVDSKTESVVVEITGDAIPTEELSNVIRELGATVHSIDEVEAEHPH